jgi:hypothetical protein
LLVPDLRIAYLTLNQRMRKRFNMWQISGSRVMLLTMNTSAGLYLKGLRRFAGDMGFAVQEDAEQFLLEAGGAVDRWLGAAWVGAAMDLNRLLAERRAPGLWWTPSGCRSIIRVIGWQAWILQMTQVWSQDNALGVPDTR